MMDNPQKDALDFLVFSYFSFSLEDLENDKEDKVAGLIIKRAYRDAASHVLSVRSVDGLPFTTPEELKESAASIIAACLNCLCQNAEKDGFEYTTWHKNLCIHLMDLYEKAGCTWGKNSGEIGKSVV